MTLQEMKAAIIADYSWHSQHGPDDSDGYARDVRQRKRIESARTWGKLADTAPCAWSSAVVNRCHRDQL